MMRERAELVVEAACSEGLDRAADSLVEHDPSGRAELLVEGLADQRVRKAEPAGYTGGLDDDPHGDAMVEDVEQLVGREVRDVRDDVEVELASDNCADRQRPVRGRAEAAEAPSHHLTDSFGHTELVERTRQHPRIVLLAQRAALGEMDEYLF